MRKDMSLRLHSSLFLLSLLCAKVALAQRCTPLLTVKEVNSAGDHNGGEAAAAAAESKGPSTPILVLDPAGLQLLRSYADTNVALTTIIGPHRVGKSSLLNLLSDRLRNRTQHSERGGDVLPFETGDTVRSVTKSVCLHPLNNNGGDEQGKKVVFLVDTPGASSPWTQLGDEVDARVMALLTSASSALLYYADGPVDAAAAKRLHLLAEYAMSVNMNAGSASDRSFRGCTPVAGSSSVAESANGDYLPSLVWIMRNLHLKLGEQDVSYSSYVQKALSTVAQRQGAGGQDEGEEKAAELNPMGGCFRDIHGFALPFPVEAVRDLVRVGGCSTQNNGDDHCEPLLASALSADYQAALEVVADAIWKVAVPKKAPGVATPSELGNGDNLGVTGSQLADLLEAWVAMINTGSSLRFDASDAVREGFNFNLIQAEKKRYLQRMETALVPSTTELLLPVAALQAEHEAALALVTSNLRGALFGGSTVAEPMLARTVLELREEVFSQILRPKYELAVFSHFEACIERAVARAEEAMKSTVLPVAEDALVSMLDAGEAAAETLLGAEVDHIFGSGHSLETSAKEEKKVVEKLIAKLSARRESLTAKNRQASEQRCRAAVSALKPSRAVAEFGMPISRKNLDARLNLHKRQTFDTQCQGPSFEDSSERRRLLSDQVVKKNDELIKEQHLFWVSNLYSIIFASGIGCSALFALWLVSPVFANEEEIYETPPDNPLTIQQRIRGLFPSGDPAGDYQDRVVTLRNNSNVSKTALKALVYVGALGALFMLIWFGLMLLICVDMTPGAFLRFEAKDGVSLIAVMNALRYVFQAVKKFFEIKDDIKEHLTPGSSGRSKGATRGSDEGSPYNTPKAGKKK